MIVQRATETGIVYPDSDGEPMADNTKQWRWIVVIGGNLAALYRDNPDVFVAGNHLWYPEEGHPEIRIGPDCFVVFGRPKGDRGSYRQWEEGGIAPQVVFEILSPGNDPLEMADKLAFYDEYGVEEYYLYDPDRNQLAVYRRQGTALRRVRGEKVWTSPRLGIRFDLTEGEMKIYYPDGRLFKTFEEVVNDLEQAEKQRNQAALERDQARQQAKDAQERAARLAERLRQAGLDPDA
jgi:Uma2 family endonuclease